MNLVFKGKNIWEEVDMNFLCSNLVYKLNTNWSEVLIEYPLYAQYLDV